MRQIDAELLTTNIAQIAKNCARSDAQKALIGRILFMIDNMPTNEAEPVKHDRKMIPMTFESIAISPKAERAMIGVENALLYQIKKLKSCVKSDNSDYLTGYLCALSAVEGIIEEGKR